MESVLGSNEGVRPRTLVPSVYSLRLSPRPSTVSWTRKRNRRLGRPAVEKTGLVRILSSSAKTLAGETSMCDMANDCTTRLIPVRTYRSVCGIVLTLESFSAQSEWVKRLRPSKRRSSKKEKYRYVQASFHRSRD